MTINKVVPNKLFLDEVCNLLESGKKVKFRPKGNSMFPFIDEKKDTLILVPLIGIPNKGDIVLAETDSGQYVVHRVVDKLGKELILMGDGNLAGKESCIAQDIKGVVSAIMRNGKSRNMEALSYQWSVKLWMWMLPVRRYLLFVLKRILK